MAETIESLLANSLWVLLTPSAQQYLSVAFEKVKTYERRLDGIEGFVKEFGDDVWTDDAYVFTGVKKEWRWTTFPHPSSWPKTHHDVIAFMIPSYSEKERTYKPGSLFMRRRVEVESLKTEGKYRWTDVMLSMSYVNLLVYADLVTEPVREHEGEDLANHMKELLSIASTISNDPFFVKDKRCEEFRRYLLKLKKIVETV